MITNKMKEWLEHQEQTATPKKRKQYHRRIQKMIDVKMDVMLWLAKNRPDVLLNEVAGVAKIDEPRHKRLQQLLLLIKILKPQYDVYLEMAKDIKNMGDERFP